TADGQESNTGQDFRSFQDFRTLQDVRSQHVSGPDERDRPAEVSAISRAPNGNASSVSLPKPQQTARRVLIVDDNQDSTESLAKLLKRTGHEVETALDGPTGINTARRYQPEIIFLDIGLPEMDGYEIAKRL